MSFTCTFNWPNSQQFKTISSSIFDTEFLVYEEGAKNITKLRSYTNCCNTAVHSGLSVHVVLLKLEDAHHVMYVLYTTRVFCQLLVRKRMRRRRRPKQLLRRVENRASMTTGYMEVTWVTVLSLLLLASASKFGLSYVTWRRFLSLHGSCYLTL